LLLACVTIAKLENYGLWELDMKSGRPAPKNARGGGCGLRGGYGGKEPGRMRQLNRKRMLTAEKQKQDGRIANSEYSAS
jgi:hypothetical protein